MKYTPNLQPIETLMERYPPSEPCSCSVCVNYCQRPGWWAVDKARIALSKGLGYRMMLELSPEFTFGVLSPAFKGNEGNYALQLFSHNGCTFLKNNRCELYQTGLQPLECRFCHHMRTGEGLTCHSDIEQDWHTKQGQELVQVWFWHFRNVW